MRKNSFSLIEILVVITVIAILVAILLPSLSLAKERAITYLCLSNQRQVNLGWYQFTTDNDGAMVNPGEGGSPNKWALDYGPTDSSQITNGELWPYVMDTEVYRCKREESKLRLRSYSIPYYLNGKGGPGSWWFANTPVKLISQVEDPIDRFSFVEEADPRSSTFNSGAWVNYDMYQGWWADKGDTLLDYCPANHRNSDNFIFVDGHAINYKYKDPRTQGISWIYTKMPGNIDYDFLLKGAHAPEQLCKHCGGLCPGRGGRP